MKNQIELALEIAIKAHQGQFRKDGLTPYITHPMAVAENFKSLNEEYFKEELQAISLLHDVLEDTSLTKEYLLKKGVSKVIVDAVEVLTHKKGTSYLMYILNIKQNILAVKVKKADITHNMETSSGNQLSKYQLALYILNQPFYRDK